MGYLVLSRHEGDQIIIRAEPGTDSEQLLSELLLDGIRIHIGEMGGGQVRLGIDAPQDLLILRGELDGVNSYDLPTSPLGSREGQ